MINRLDSFNMIFMKRFLPIIILVFSIQFSQAQEQDLARAKKFFDRTYYSEAIPLYENVVSNDTSLEVIRNLADAYYYTNDLKNAQKYYAFLIKNYAEGLPEDYYFKYSQTLKASGNYTAANKLYRDFLAKKSNDQALSDFDKSIKILENVSAIGERFKINNIETNTENSEFGAVEYGENLVFAQTTNNEGVFKKVYRWNNESYLNLVSIPIKNIYLKDSVAVPFSSEINSRLHESNAVFAKDGKTMYFTRNNSKNGSRQKNKEKISTLQIFKAELVGGKWDNIVSLPFNSDDYSTEHPALSPDGKTLYFASDMPGSKGSFDIFSVEINGGNFGTPKNLGDQINTIRKEQFPFVSKDNKLYFSSNGHEGYGLLDVFVSEIGNGNEFSRATNVGLPVNTGLDDFAFTINSDTNLGYFASNRKGGKGGDDIYALEETKPLAVEDCKQMITGVITDTDTKLPLENTLVVLQDLDKKELEKILTDASGSFKFTVACESAYTVLASKENYTNDSVSLRLEKERGKSNDASMALQFLEVIKKAEELALAEEKKQEKAALEEQKKEEKQAKTKEKQVAEQKKQERIEEIIAKEKDVVKEKDRLVIKTEPIYFDYDLWYIRRDSKVILDRVVELMNKYPEMVVEIGSHTDCRGNNNYNRVLSQNRATSTKEYIIDKGISKKRVFAKGYGEKVPVIRCVTEASCSEEEHELNRRSEFVIKNL
jgi:outer membrane protein OmpA-like peptidoglycan-associated protein